jgi:hypothetical protein
VTNKRGKAEAKVARVLFWQVKHAAVDSDAVSAVRRLAAVVDGLVSRTAPCRDRSTLTVAPTVGSKKANEHLSRESVYALLRQFRHLLR